jgi:hypothetical protein
MNDECQHFWNTIASKLRNYNDTVKCVIQNEIMSVFLNANRGFYERYHHTHLQPINPLPKWSISKVLSKFQSSSAHFSFISLFSKPFSAMLWKHSPSPFSQYNNSILPRSFPTKSISPAMTSSEENINTRVFDE